MPDYPVGIVACEECGRMFAVRTRRLRAIAAGTASAKCHLCRYQVPLIVTEEMRRWWRERFSDEQLVEMAQACWGVRERWTDDWRDGFLFEPAPVPRIEAA